MMVKKRNEDQWRDDLIELLQVKFPNLIIERKNILKDVFLKKNKNKEFELQLGFFEQDIVIYRKNDLLNIKDLNASKSLKIHNNNGVEKNTLIIPSIIIELKYDGVNTHGLITYSNIASDIKSIFPNCKYLFVLRYNSGSSDNKFLRNGKNFDNILYFQNEGNYGKQYNKGDFKKDRDNSEEITEKWKSLIDYIEPIMNSKQEMFLK